jgi:hypothetical protein
MILDSRHVRSFNEWVDQASVTLDRISGQIPRVEPELPWQEWVHRLLAIPVFNTPDTPRPEFYQTWQDWADDFNLVYNA